MTASNEFDRLLKSWLETAGPADARPEVVRGAIATAAGATQRGRLAGLIFGPASWPRPLRSAGLAGLPPGMRIAVIAGLVLALVAGALIGSGGLRGLLARPTSNVPATVVPSTLAPTPVAGAPVWDAVYLRPVSAAPGADLAVYLVRPDGQERLIRRLSAAGLDGVSSFATWGDVSETGWLAVGTVMAVRIPTAPYGYEAIVQLADPNRATLLVPANGAIGGRWSSTDLFAVPNPSDFGMNIVDPPTGAKTVLGKVLLFGGGPSIVWARDGSGILDAGRLRPADGSPDIAIDPSLLFDNREVGIGRHTVEVCPALPIPESGCPDAATATVRVIDINGLSVAWYTSADPTEQVSFPSFTSDGRGLWLTLDRVVSGRHQVVIARADAPSQLTIVATIDIAEGFGPYLRAFAPDDSQMLLGWMTGSQANPQLGPTLVLSGDGSQKPGPVGSVVGYVVGSLAESWPALGDFGSPNP